MSNYPDIFAVSWAGDLLGWYERHRRALPWRDTTDPYRILVSEVMLQQTQAARVRPAYQRFLDLFPTVEALAAAPRADVLRAWEGLGYNRRAVALHEAAQAIVGRHGGQVPADLDALRALPGVGDYTARAVQAFAYGRPSAPVDTNVARVLTRAVAGRPTTRRALQRLADTLVPAGREAAWSSALMDLGAAHCRARAPRCDGCPVAGACAWRRQGGDDPWGGVKAPPQAPFPGSDRYHRGRLLGALRRGPVAAADVAAAAALHADQRRAVVVAESLTRDGLAQWAEGRLQLPA
jgi:A/G-specific adenine glycosylase